MTESSPEFQALLKEKIKAFQIQKKARSRYLQEYAKMQVNEDFAKEIYISFRAAQDEVEALGKAYTALQNQKEQLEKLCRSVNAMQKEKDAAHRKMIEEQEAKRMELSTQFQNSIEEINSKFQLHENQIAKQNETITALSNEREQILKQMSIKDKQIETLEKKSELENKLFQSQQAETQSVIDKLLEKNQQLHSHCESLNAKNINLHKQLEGYAQNFDGIQKSMKESSVLFEKYKNDQIEMQKTMKTLHKEKNDLLDKTRKSDLKLIELYELTQQQQEIIQKLKTRNETLEKLCRALQEKNHALTTGTTQATVEETTTPSVAEDSNPTESTPNSQPVQDDNLHVQ